jgi:histidinol-phosphatase
MEADFEKRVEFAHRLADEAGAVIRPFFRKRIDVTDKGVKGDYDPVTEADRRAEEAIRTLISRHYPEDGILGEELGVVAGTSPYRWLIDPIDGTRAFICGQPLWGTLLALQRADESVLGILDQPILHERFVGFGGKAEIRANGETVPLRTRPCVSLKQATISTTHPWSYFTDAQREAFVRLSGKARMTRFGGDCYAYGLLAMGFVDLIAEAQLKPWDIQPLIPIIEGAGGIVTDWQGEPVKGSGNVIAAGDPRVHAEAVAILSHAGWGAD